MTCNAVLHISSARKSSSVHRQSGCTWPGVPYRNDSPGLTISPWAAEQTGQVRLSKTASHRRQSCTPDCFAASVLPKLKPLADSVAAIRSSCGRNAWASSSFPTVFRSARILSSSRAAVWAARSPSRLAAPRKRARFSSSAVEFPPMVALSLRMSPIVTSAILRAFAGDEIFPKRPKSRASANASARFRFSRFRSAAWSSSVCVLAIRYPGTMKRKRFVHERILRRFKSFRIFFFEFR